ncbi:MAG: PaaX family transcriptional regulator C-terminal domain-containing protein, partial [Candidatus Levybacteria bacterium]|nr:PaaX family transcriptional regulator C-terminal domain-containing protein [Candidatus Levybacteria bacterium]
IIDKINEYLTAVRGREKILNKNDSEIKRIKKEYLNVLLSDPFLPRELLPNNWKGEQVKNLIKKLK